MVNFAVAQTAEPIVSQFRGRARVAHETVHQFDGGCTLAPAGEYD